MKNFLNQHWPFPVNAFLLAVLVWLGLYLFDDAPATVDALDPLSDWGSALTGGGAAPFPLDWRVALFGGVLVGGLIGGLICGSWQFLPAFEEQKSFGWKLLRTAVLGMIGGFLIQLGSRLAGAGFDGQIAGAMQLAPGGWLFLLVGFGTAGVLSLVAERRGQGGGKGGKGAAKKGKEEQE